MRTVVGDKFYRVLEDDSIEIVRIKRIKNQNTFVCLDKDNKDIKLTDKQLEEYVKLKPDGFLTLSIVELQDKIKDVIVSVHRRKDVEEHNSPIPYAVCRQNVYDVFTNAINRDNTKTYVGCSVSIDTVPADIDYKMFLACNSIVHSIIISIYLDDKFNEIISLIQKKSRYDEILSILSNGIMNSNVYGYCPTLEQLLKENRFMFDFHKAFNIDEVDFEVQTENEYELIPEQRIYLEDMLKEEMFQTYVIKYDKEIDINKIQRSHIIVSDKNEQLYIIAYDKGEYINRTYRDNIKDKRDAVTLLKFKRQQTNK